MVPWYHGTRRAPTTAAAAAEEFLARPRPGIPTHPGIKYPVRHSPHFDIYTSGTHAQAHTMVQVRRIRRIRRIRRMRIIIIREEE